MSTPDPGSLSFDLPRHLVDARELARIIGCGEPQVRKLTRTTDMPRVRIGGRGVRFDAGAVLAWLQARNGSAARSKGGSK